MKWVNLHEAEASLRAFVEELELTKLQQINHIFNKYLLVQIIIFKLKTIVLTLILALIYPSQVLS